MMAGRAAPILPLIDDLNRPFWDGCAAGELRLQACRSCGRLRYPISDRCPNCLSRSSDWRVLSGDGEILSWAVFQHSYQAAWADRIPYNVVLVQLREGPRMFGNVEPLERQDLAVGAPVHVVFVPADPTAASGEPAAMRIPRWRLA
jgi:uncharacterized OB-fold protein